MARYQWPLAGTLCEPTFGDRKVPFTLTSRSSGVSTARSANMNGQPQSFEHFHRMLRVCGDVYELNPCIANSESDDVLPSTVNTRGRYAPVVASLRDDFPWFGRRNIDVRRFTRGTITGFTTLTMTAGDNCVLSGGPGAELATPVDDVVTTMSFFVEVSGELGETLSFKETLASNTTGSSATFLFFRGGDGFRWDLSEISINDTPLTFRRLSSKERDNEPYAFPPPQNEWAECIVPSNFTQIKFSYTKSATTLTGTKSGGTGPSRAFLYKRVAGLPVPLESFITAGVSLNLLDELCGEGFSNDHLGVSSHRDTYAYEEGNSSIVGFQDSMTNELDLSQFGLLKPGSSSIACTVYISRRLICGDPAYNLDTTSAFGVSIPGCVSVSLRMDQAEKLCDRFGATFRGERTIWLISAYDGLSLMEGYPRKVEMCLGGASGLGSSLSQTDIDKVTADFGVVPVNNTANGLWSQYGATWSRPGGVCHSHLVHGVTPMVTFFKPNEFFGGQFTMSKGIGALSSLDRRGRISADLSEIQSMKSDLGNDGAVVIDWMMFSEAQRCPDIFVTDPDLATAIAEAGEGEVRSVLVNGVPLGTIRDGILKYGPTRLFARTLRADQLKQYRYGTLSKSPVDGSYSLFDDGPTTAVFAGVFIVNTWPAGGPEEHAADAELELGIDLIDGSDPTSIESLGASSIYDLSETMRWIYYYFVEQRVVDLCNCISVFSSVPTSYVVERS